MTTVGLCVPQLGEYVDRDTLQEFVVRAQAAGFASLWVQEHLFYPLEPRSGYSGIPAQPIPAPYRSTLAGMETLAVVAGWTDRIEIGTSVLVAGYHRPVELAQRLATLDVLSGGRLIAGISVGWSAEEHEQMDVDPGSRGRRCDELVKALLRCWGPDPVTFAGEFFSIPSSIVRPKPLQRPRPRLMSGMRSRAGLERTAQLFDIWNPSRGSVEEVAQKARRIDALRGGRPPIEVYQRVFLEPPIADVAESPPGIDGIVAAHAAARAAGFASLIIDGNFWREIRSPADWTALPERLATALSLA